MNSGYEFKDKKLFECALTPSSYANERRTGGLSSYERLEFLGDAALDVIISERLFLLYPDSPEGELTRLRACLVCEASLAKKALELGLNARVKVGKGEAHTGGGDKSSILCDVFEAVVGAIFLDGGFDAAKSYALPLFEKDIAELKFRADSLDAKSFLQEELQKRSREPVSYRMIAESGPDHDKLFTVEALHGEKVMGSGRGKTKKEAEQNAAADAIERMGISKTKKSSSSII